MDFSTNANAVDGFLNLNKPAEHTSHDCVARVRRLLRQKKVGHGGTLDPAATGVLPIALGKATRLLQYLSHRKAYRATVRFGVITATDDLEGEVLHQTPAPELTLAQVEAALPQFQGTIRQIPPAYSAIQVEGKRLYDLARSGQSVEVPERIVEVESIQVLDWRSGAFPELDLAIACGTGTYIRAIARDLGTVLGSGGTLAALQRTASSGFLLADSLTLEELEAQVEEDCFEPIPPAVAIAHLPEVRLSLSESKRWCQGQALLSLPSLKEQAIGTLIRVQDESNSLIGVGQHIYARGSSLLAPKLVLL